MKELVISRFFHRLACGGEAGFEDRNAGFAEKEREGKVKELQGRMGERIQMKSLFYKVFSISFFHPMSRNRHISISLFISFTIPACTRVRPRARVYERGG